jgi:hypothetical protein
VPGEKSPLPGCCAWVQQNCSQEGKQGKPRKLLAQAKGREGLGQASMGGREIRVYSGIDAGQRARASRSSSCSRGRGAEERGCGQERGCAEETTFRGETTSKKST